MMLVKRMLCLGLIVSVVSTVTADEEKGKKKGERKVPTASQRFVGKMELTDAQKEQVAAIDKEFADKLKELTDARKKILTADQVKAEAVANKSNRQSGKSGKVAKAAIEEALKLTDDQKSQMKAHAKLQEEFNSKVIESLKKVLTPEQQEKLPKQGREKGKKKNA